VTTDTLELVHSLQDPSPPVPGAAVRAAVGARATQIRRRRRATGALAAASCAALLAVGTLAVVVTGSSSHHRVETAAAPATVADPGDVGTGTTDATTPVPADVVDTTIAPATAPSTAQISVQVTEGSIPADVELDATLTGDPGSFSAHLHTPGTLAFADVPPGDYVLRWSWTSDDGTAQAAGRVPVHVEPGDVALSL
jgi:hypothetical protein